MFEIEIHNTRVRTKEGVSANTGKEYCIREQEAFVYLNGEPYPTKMKIQLAQTQQPYEAGKYQLTPEFYVGQFGDLRIGMRDAIVERVADKPKAVANG